MTTDYHFYTVGKKVGKDGPLAFVATFHDQRLAEELARRLSVDNSNAVSAGTDAFALFPVQRISWRWTGTGWTKL